MRSLGVHRERVLAEKGAEEAFGRPVKAIRTSLGDALKNHWFSMLFEAMGVSGALSRRSLVVLGRSLGGRRHLRPAMRWIRRDMVDLNDLKASSEQNWEPEGTPKVAQGASRLTPKLSVSRG